MPASDDANMWLKIIAFVVLLEYIFVRPKIIPAMANDHTDFIGFVLCHAVLVSLTTITFGLQHPQLINTQAYFCKINIKDLAPQQRTTALWNGALGGAFGYAWLLFQLKPLDREIHHLLLANVAILAGVLAGAWAERRKKGGRLRTGKGQRLVGGKLVP